MNGSHHKSMTAQHAPQRPRAFTITALNRPSHGRSGRCAPVAYLRMSGQWMEQYGFRPGCRVVVTAEDGRLVLTLADHAGADLTADVAPSHSCVRGLDACDGTSN